MSIYDKKLYIKKTDGNIQTANLYTDKNDVGDNYLTFKYNGNTVYAVLNTNGDIDFNVSYNHNLYRIKSNVVIWKTDEYRMSKLYPSTYSTMTALPNDRDWIEFVRYRKDLNEMFQSCENLTTVPLFDTQNVIVMDSMFQRCHKLTTVPQFDTSNVEYMSSMFIFCTSLTTIPQFDTSNVIYMQYMFSGCTNLTTVPLFNTQNVFNMQSMFSGCTNLTGLPIFDIRNVKYIQNMIEGTNITKITFKNKPADLEITPGILGKPDVQITFV